MGRCPCPGQVTTEFWDTVGTYNYDASFCLPLSSCIHRTNLFFDFLSAIARRCGIVRPFSIISHPCGHPIIVTVTLTVTEFAVPPVRPSRAPLSSSHKQGWERHVLLHLSLFLGQGTSCDFGEMTGLQTARTLSCR